eukprot:Gb_26243 [translate_table: standard]
MGIQFNKFTQKVGFCVWILSILCIRGTTDPGTETLSEVCGTSGSYHEGSEFQQNLNIFLQKLMSRVSEMGKFYVVDSHPMNGSAIYGLAQCKADLSSSECKTRISVAVNNVLHGCKTTSAVIQMKGCYLRYDVQMWFFRKSWEGNEIICNAQNNSDPGFPSAVKGVLANVSRRAELDGMANETSQLPSSMRLYASAQCFGHDRMHEEACPKCLLSARKGLLSCGEKNLGARILTDNCFLRYEAYNFFNTLPSTTATNEFNKGRKSKLSIILGVIAAGITVLSLTSLFVWKYVAASKWKLIHQGKDEDGVSSAGLLNSKLHFKYEILKKATENFHSKNTLGKGAFGSVHKGILPDGREIAVKRLFVNSRQGDPEFVNEVNIISRVQHRNLVKLLGCSIKGPERLLVYEYLSNRSLDKILFDGEKSHILDWQRRFDIILGTARGLAYLHEESQIRIVHRDVKASNILVDDNFKAKIADFGLARLLGDDQSHITTGIAGTLGYMDPQYVLNGHLTEKADVFSFGVLALEIVSGKRNFEMSSEDMSSLLAKTWRLYQSGNLSSIIDLKLKGDIYPEAEVLLVIHVALLCTQASSTVRPKMSEVVLMLINGSDEMGSLPRPSKPSLIGVLDLSVIVDIGNSMSSMPLLSSQQSSQSGGEAETLVSVVLST